MIFLRISAQSRAAQFVSLYTTFLRIRQQVSAFTMSRDTTLQSDIGKANAIAKDGAFKRVDAAFRNHVTKSGQFAPEKGMSCKDLDFRW